MPAAQLPLCLVRGEEERAFHSKRHFAMHKMKQQQTQIQKCTWEEQVFTAG